MTDTRPIASIVVGERIREDLGGLDELAEKIRRDGVLEPIGISPDGRLSYGERRLRAAQKAGLEHVPVIIRDVTDEQRIRFEIEENIARKGFTPSEAVKAKRKYEAAVRAMAAVRMKAGVPYANLAQGPKGTARDQTAVLTGYGYTSLAKAEAVVAAAEAEPERFGKLVEDMDRTGKVDRAYKFLTVTRDREAYEARKEKGGTVADLEALAASGFQARVIYADPAWKFKNYGPGGKLHTSADNHYDTQVLDEICALGPVIQRLAAPDSVLFLWTVWPLMLPNRWQEGLGKVITAWGFEYKTCAFLWEKIITAESEEQDADDPHFFWGNGNWTRSNTEPCLLATRGSPKRLGFNVHQVVRAPALKHSEKPEEVAQRIERLVAGPYLELYARGFRPGWYCWGNELEVPKAEAAE